MPSFDRTRVLLSFGAAAGGFEFAMQLRRDIMEKFDKTEQGDPFFAYVDAESLRNDAHTTYTWSETLGIWKMANPFWDEFYKGAMSTCKYMVFLISESWLRSNWCWDEFRWYQKAITERGVKPVFVVFPDAQVILNGSNIVKDARGNSHNLKEIWLEMITRPGAATIDIATAPDPAVGRVVVEGETYSYTHKYVCSEAERRQILSKITGL